jgi:hypothetical protein
MRARAILWIPLLLSVGTISWALLVAGMVLLGAVILTPALADVKAAEATRNDYQATIELLDQQIALQKDFAQAATTDPVLMHRLASRQLGLAPAGQEMLVLDREMQNKDRSVKSLLAESLKPVQPRKVAPLNPLLAMTTNAALRPMLIMLACAAIGLSFMLGVKYQRR